MGNPKRGGTKVRPFLAASSSLRKLLLVSFVYTNIICIIQQGSTLEYKNNRLNIIPCIPTQQVITRIKYIVIILLVFFSCFELKAQAKLDSLSAIWNNEANTDTSRLNAIDQISMDLVAHYPDSAIYYALIMDKYAREKGFKEYIARSLYIIGNAYDSKGELSEAGNYFERANIIYGEIGN